MKRKIIGSSQFMFKNNFTPDSDSTIQPLKKQKLFVVPQQNYPQQPNFTQSQVFFPNYMNFNNAPKIFQPFPTRPQPTQTRLNPIQVVPQNPTVKKNQIFLPPLNFHEPKEEKIPKNQIPYFILSEGFNASPVPKQSGGRENKVPLPKHVIKLVVPFSETASLDFICFSRF
jgi:hypothetical protein